MTVYYRIYDIHDETVVADGSAEFRHVIGDEILVGPEVYVVKKCRTRNVRMPGIARSALTDNVLELLCVRRPG